MQLSDQELLKRFARSGAEDSFRELVRRHTDLVFGTAFRVVGERTAAEEIAQNVFVALARKAAFLPADTCLSAWLHRSSVLEARSWLRGELRRKRREQQAGESMMEPNESMLNPLTTALDEALLDLREQDRTALLLRYIEKRKLKEVGEALGISEDTAQKRVAKAIELLTRAFRKRGYAVPSVAVTVSLLEGLGHAAPMGLVASVANVALSSAMPAASLSGGTLLLAKFMALTKIQTASVCVLLGALPVAYHWELNRRADFEQRRLEQSLEFSAAELDELRTQRNGLQRSFTLGDSDLLAQRAEFQRVLAAPFPELPAADKLYQWEEQSDYVRLPKQVLSKVRLTPAVEQIGPNGERQIARGEVLDETGYLSPILLEALGLDANQAAHVQNTFLNFVAEFDSLVNARMQLTNSMPPGVFLGPASAPEMVTLRTVAFPDEGAELKHRLEQTLDEVIGPDRREILMEKQATGAFESDFLDFGKQERWIAATRQDNGLYRVARTRAENGRSYGATMVTVPYEGLPDELKPYFPKEKSE